MRQTNLEAPLNSQTVPDLPPDLHILDYLAFLAKRKWVVILTVFISASAFLGASYIMPYSFESQARILPPDRMASAGLLNSLNASGALKILKEIENPSVDLLQNYLESRTLAERLARESAVRSYFQNRSYTHDELVDEIMQTIHVDPKFSRIDLRITVSTPWFSTKQEKEQARLLPAVMAQVAIRVMDSLMQSEIRSDAHQHLLYAQMDYATRKTELDSLEAQQEAFEQAHGIVQLKTQTIAEIEQFAQMKTEEAEAQIRAASFGHDLTAGASERALASAQASATSNVMDQFKLRSDIGPAFNELPEVNREYANILLRRAAIEPIAVYLAHEVEQEKIDQEREQSIVTLLDPALAPEVRSSPKRIPMLLLGLFSGFVLSVLIVSAQTVFESWRIQRGRS